MNKKIKECAEFFDHVYGTILEAMNAPAGSNTNISCDGEIYLTNNESDNFWDQSLQLNIPRRNYSKKFYYFRDGGKDLVFRMTELYTGEIDIVASMTDRIINAIGEAA